MADKKKMSVAEIMAAARAQKGAGVAQSDATETKPANDPEAASSAEAEVAPKAKPVPKPVAAKPAGGARPSVADILAAARAKKAADGEAGAGEAAVEKPKPAAAEKPKPAVKPAAAAAAKSAAASAPKTGVQRDTASILAAARGGLKPGPVSKAEAPALTAKMQAPAAKPKAVAPVEKAAVARVAPPAPVRPAKTAAKKEGEEDRRGFLEIALGSFMAMGFTALSVTGGLFTLGLARFMFPNVLAEPPSRFKVGFREGFPAGKVET